MTLLTPLHWAAYNNDMEVVHLLIEKGVELKFSSYHETPLSVAGNCKNLHVMSTLLDYWWKINGESLIKTLGIVLKDRVEL